MCRSYLKIEQAGQQIRNCWCLSRQELSILNKNRVDCEHPLFLSSISYAGGGGRAVDLSTAVGTEEAAEDFLGALLLQLDEQQSKQRSALANIVSILIENNEGRNNSVLDAYNSSIGYLTKTSKE